MVGVVSLLKVTTGDHNASKNSTHCSKVQGTPREYFLFACYFRSQLDPDHQLDLVLIKERLCV